MNHYNGWIEIKNLEEFSNVDGFKILRINYDTDLTGKDYNYNKMKQVIMNQISGNHKLEI